MNNLKNNNRTIFFLPLIIILDIPFIAYAVHQGNMEYFIGIIISILIPLLLLNLLNIKPFFFVLLSAPILYLTTSFDVLVFDLGYSHYNISTWQAVFDTNPQESKEFLGILRQLTLIIGLFQIFTLIFYAIISFKMKKNTITIKTKLIIATILIILSIDFSLNGFTAKSFPFGYTLHSYIDYRKQTQLEKELFPQKQKYQYHATENKEFLNDSLNKTLVVLVTESIRGDHLGYNGYYRNTTPNMAKENIITYQNLISPANQTVNTLRRVFSQAEENNDSLFFAKPTIITAFKEAGYHTSWYSTQSVRKNGESKNSVIAKESDVFVYKNNEHIDSILFDDLEKAFQNQAEKKLIIIHIFGVHYQYQNRFPKEFAQFSKEKNKNYQQDQINKYDDAILYNDYFQHQILEMLKKQKGEKIFITFSDHGESLFESGPNIQGHGALEPAKIEFIIPFTLWFSDSYIKHHPKIYQSVVSNKKVPSINSDFFYSVPYLLGIEFEELNPEKNYFSEHYKIRKRKVVNSALDLLYFDKLK